MWDIQTGQEVCTLISHMEKAKTMFITPNGSYLTVISSDGTLQCWDLKTCNRIQNTDNVAGYLVNWNYGSPEISHILNNSIRIYDIERMKLTTYNNDDVLEDYVVSSAITPDSSYAVFGFRDGTIMLSNLSTGVRYSILEAHKGAVNTIAISLNRRLIISGAEDNTAKVWNLDDPSTQVLTILHDHPVNLISITPDQGHVISAFGSKIKAWDLTTGKDIWLSHTYRRPIASVYLYLNGLICITYSSSPLDSRNFTILNYNQKNREVFRIDDYDEHHVLAVAGYGNEYAVYALTNCSLRIVKFVQNNNIVADLITHKGNVFTVNVSDDGRYAVSGSEKGEVKIWDLVTYREISQHDGHESAVLSAIVSNSLTSVSGSYDGILKVWDVKAAKEMAIAALDGPVECIDMSSDERTLLVGDRLGNVYCIEYVNPKQMTELGQNI
jgi:WD40 repeat protein